MNTANTKAVTVTVELITTCWAPRINCPCQQDLPSAKNYPYTCTTSTFAGCLGARNTGHICMCLYVSDTMFFFGNTSPVTCFASHFLQVRYCDLKWFEHISISGQRSLWSAPYDMIRSKMCHRTPFLSTWHGMDQTWVSTKLDGLRWFNLVLKPYSQLWLHGVSQYFNLESGLSLASGWNLCCAAISFIASHLSFPSVVDLLCLIGQFHIMAIFQWDDVVGKRSWHDL